MSVLNVQPHDLGCSQSKLLGEDGRWIKIIYIVMTSFSVRIFAGVNDEDALYFCTKIHLNYQKGIN